MTQPNRRAEPAAACHVRSLAAAVPSDEAADVLALMPGAIERSEYAVALVVDGETICVFGAIRDADGARVWMHATPPATRRRHARWFVEETRRQAAELLRRFGKLYTATGSSRTEALRWMRAIGFATSPPETCGERTICRAEVSSVS